jgi:reactive intermediate/imine deaminase
MQKMFYRFLALAFLLVSFIAFAAPPATKKEIYTSTAPAPIGTYSQAIQTGNTVYISGQIPIDPNTGDLIGGDFSAQVEQVLKNISEITKAAGGNLDNITKLTVFVTDLNNFNIVNDVMKKYFQKPYPARAVIEIKALPKNSSVEIESIMQLY